MNQTRSQMFSGDLVRLRRLGDLLAFIADLPAFGAIVLVGTRGAREEMRDLILQYRGTPMLDETKVQVCQTRDHEIIAAAGADRSKVYAAPGFDPQWAFCANRTGLSSPAPEAKPAPNAFFPQVVERTPVPGALRHAWPTAQPDPITGTAPSRTDRRPKMADAAPLVRDGNISINDYRGISGLTPLALGAASSTDHDIYAAGNLKVGPWHKPTFAPRPSVEVVVHSRFLPGTSDKPYRLFADTPFGGGYHSVHDTQEEADAALPGFVQHVRELWFDHAVRNDTVPVSLAA